MMNMGLLLFLGRKVQNKLMTGDLFLIYLIIYPVGRFALEFMRLDPSNIGGMNANQTTMAVIAILSAATLVLKHTVLKKKTSAIKVTPEIQ